MGTFAFKLRLATSDRLDKLREHATISFIAPRRIMPSAHPNPTDVEQLLLNARLRDELEPFFDESVHMVDVQRMSTPMENEFLASMLAWERAPVLPISRWFEPELVLPHPDALDEQAIHELLWETIHRLYEKRI